MGEKNMMDAKTLSEALQAEITKLRAVSARLKELAEQCPIPGPGAAAPPRRAPRRYLSGKY